MLTTRYLSVSKTIAIHADLIEAGAYGGAHNVRDTGALESALLRPQTGYYNDAIDETCALLESLARNHAFVDGNRRVAFARFEEKGSTRNSSARISTQLMNLFKQQAFRLAELNALFRGQIKPAGAA